MRLIHAGTNEGDEAFYPMPAGTFYPPSAGTGGFMLANPPFASASVQMQTPTPQDPAADLEATFRAWWAESFPAAPPGPHAVRTHVAFAAWLLAQQQGAAGPEAGA